MSEIDAQIQIAEATLEDAKETVKLGDMLEKLYSNREFKKIILDGYFRDTATSLTANLTNPAMLDKRDDLVEQLVGISALRTHLFAVNTKAQHAREAIEAHEYEIELLRQEAVEGV